eukprot:ANDGO_05669.mRNA.1 hypothetical protein
MIDAYCKAMEKAFAALVLDYQGPTQPTRNRNAINSAYCIRLFCDSLQRLQGVADISDIVSDADATSFGSSLLGMWTSAVAMSRLHAQRPPIAPLSGPVLRDRETQTLTFTLQDLDIEQTNKKPAQEQAAGKTEVHPFSPQFQALPAKERFATMHGVQLEIEKLLFQKPGSGDRDAENSDGVQSSDEEHFLVAKYGRDERFKDGELTSKKVGRRTRASAAADSVPRLQSKDPGAATSRPVSALAGSYLAHPSFASDLSSHYDASNASSLQGVSPANERSPKRRSPSRVSPELARSKSASILRGSGSTSPASHHSLETQATLQKKKTKKKIPKLVKKDSVSLLDLSPWANQDRGDGDDVLGSECADTFRSNAEDSRASGRRYTESDICIPETLRNKTVGHATRQTSSNLVLMGAFSVSKNNPILAPNVRFASPRRIAQFASAEHRTSSPPRDVLHLVPVDKPQIVQRPESSASENALSGFGADSLVSAGRASSPPASHRKPMNPSVQIVRKEVLVTGNSPITTKFHAASPSAILHAVKSNARSTARTISLDAQNQPIALRPHSAVASRLPDSSLALIPQQSSQTPQFVAAVPPGAASRGTPKAASPVVSTISMTASSADTTTLKPNSSKRRPVSSYRPKSAAVRAAAASRLDSVSVTSAESSISKVIGWGALSTDDAYDPLFADDHRTQYGKPAVQHRTHGARLSSSGPLPTGSGIVHVATDDEDVELDFIARRREPAPV